MAALVCESVKRLLNMSTSIPTPQITRHNAVGDKMMLHGRDHPRTTELLRQTNEILDGTISSLDWRLEKSKSATMKRYTRDLHDVEDFMRGHYGCDNNFSTEDYNVCRLCNDNIQCSLTLPCQGQHRFCKKCILEWMEDCPRKQCPLCRTWMTESWRETRDQICREDIRGFRRDVAKAIVKIEQSLGMAQSLTTKVSGRASGKRVGSVLAGWRLRRDERERR